MTMNVSRHATNNRKLLPKGQSAGDLSPFWSHTRNLAWSTAMRNQVATAVLIQPLGSKRAWRFGAPGGQLRISHSNTSIALGDPQ
jgi:hypothetical protein